MDRRHEEFDEFYLAELRPLRRLAYLLTRNWSEAEELAQDAMERTFRAWDRILDRDRANAYARSVLMNCHRSILRRAVVQAKHRFTTSGTVEGPPDLSEDRMLLWAAVSALPVRNRQAIVLRFYEDLPDAEIAEIMGCPVGTVKSLLHRGLARLRTSTGLERVLSTVGSESA